MSMWFNVCVCACVHGVARFSAVPACLLHASSQARASKTRLKHSSNSVQCSIRSVRAARQRVPPLPLSSSPFPSASSNRMPD